jgi:hypothetical protein
MGETAIKQTVGHAHGAFEWKAPTCLLSQYSHDDEMCNDVDHCVMFLKRRRYREGDSFDD